MRNPRSNRKITLILACAGAVVVLAGGGWLIFHKGPGKSVEPAADPNSVLAKVAPPPPKADVRRPVTSQPRPPAPTTSLASQPRPESRPVTTQMAATLPARPQTEPNAPPPPASTSTEIAAARKLVESGKLLDARQQLDALMKRNLAEADDAAARELLSRIANETVFSPKGVPGDPLTETHDVASGENLTVIARNYDVPPEALALVNRMKSPDSLRAGQKLRIPKGPFHVKIYKSKFRLDLYLGDVYVRSYRVGLGANDGTPTGIWKVRERLRNPRYFPSASAADKRIIEPGDPNNPLGKYWIALEGLEGAAVGQSGYGIHGTIEPDSIGKSVSLGCIRMLNEEVEVVFALVKENRTLVTVLP